MADDPAPETMTMRVFHETPVLFANFFRVSHVGVSFELDFGQLDPSPEIDGGAQRTISTVARIAVPAQFVPALLLALNENVKKYETVYGPIQSPVPGASREATQTGEVS